MARHDFPNRPHDARLRRTCRFPTVIAVVGPREQRFDTRLEKRLWQKAGRRSVILAEIFERLAVPLAGFHKDCRHFHCLGFGAGDDPRSPRYDAARGK
jgi:hypothetical protein